MIDPTDEMADAFDQAWRAYWVALGHETPERGPTVAEHGREANRAGLAAALGVVERDYDVRPKASVCAETTPRLVGTGLHRCNLPGGHIGPHRSDTAVWDGEP